jgi:hypothetical protein
MADNILEIAKQEAERLKLVLSKNEDFQKLQIVQRLIDTYENIDEKRTSGLPSIPTPVAKPSSLRALLNAQQARQTKVFEVNKIVAEYLKKTGVRASSGDLLPVVLDAGVDMPGQVPAKTLSSFLSTSKHFNNVKGLGYGLVEWGDSPGPNAVPGSEPPIPDGNHDGQEKPDMFS